ncbi:MAG: hypothetical protein WD533_08900 [Dehalococcoidia bacterium]
MTGPDPNFITAADWQAITGLLVPLFLILATALGLAFSFLLAHGIIPSLAATRELSPRFAMLRAPLYGTAAVFLVLVFLSIALFAARMNVIADLFWRGAQ